MSMISCKLLSNVLNKSIYGLRVVDNHIEYDYENGMPLMSQGAINIHELAHMVKEWSIWEDYNIDIKMRVPDIYIYIYIKRKKNRLWIFHKLLSK